MFVCQIYEYPSAESGAGDEMHSLMSHRYVMVILNQSVLTDGYTHKNWCGRGMKGEANKTTGKVEKYSGVSCQLSVENDDWMRDVHLFMNRFKRPKHIDRFCMRECGRGKCFDAGPVG